MVAISVVLGIMAVAKVFGAIYVYAFTEEEKFPIWYLKQGVYSAVFIAIAINAWWFGVDDLEEIKDEME